MRLTCTVAILLSFLCGCNYTLDNSAQIDAWNKQYEKQLDATDRQIEQSGLQQEKTAKQLQRSDKQLQYMAELQKQLAEQIKKQQRVAANTEALQKRVDAQIKKQEQVAANTEILQKRFGVLLQRWEKQADRYDAVLAKMERNPSRPTAVAPRTSSPTGNL